MLLNTILAKIDTYTTKHPWKNGSKQILQNAMSDNKTVMEYLASLDPQRGVVYLIQLVPDAFPRELQKVDAADLVIKMNIHGQWRVDPPATVVVSKKKQRNAELAAICGIS
jgi:hypothetical protein